MCYLLFIFLPVLINVAFLTLYERKILGLSQTRKGPNKVSFSGLLQPVSDALKLFSKESVFPEMSYVGVFVFGPIFALMLALMSWSMLPVFHGGLYFKCSLLLLLVVMSLGVYPVLFSGWCSSSAYAMIGATRGVAQTISYEISMALIFLGFFTCSMSVSLKHFYLVQEKMSFTVLCLPFFYFWVLSSVAETNRSPFDFAEGESELVSGFNIEYGGGGFALIFLAEYASIMFLSSLAGMLMGSKSFGSLVSVLSMMGLLYFWVWIRSTYPRYRYDMLMNLAWKSILPVALFILIYWIVYA